MPIFSLAIRAFRAIALRHCALDRAARATGGSVSIATSHPRGGSSSGTISRPSVGRCCRPWFWPGKNMKMAVLMQQFAACTQLRGRIVSVLHTRRSSFVPIMCSCVWRTFLGHSKHAIRAQVLGCVGEKKIRRSAAYQQHLSAAQLFTSRRGVTEGLLGNNESISTNVFSVKRKTSTASTVPAGLNRSRSLHRAVAENQLWWGLYLTVVQVVLTLKSGGKQIQRVGLSAGILRRSFPHSLRSLRAIKPLRLLKVVGSNLFFFLFT